MVVSFGHPPLPPTSEEDRIARLRLLRSSRVGIATFYRLLNEHGSAHAALDALPEIARSKGVKSYTACPMAVAEMELVAGRQYGAALVHIGEADYPTGLTKLPDPPPMIWMIGAQHCLTARRVALIGARNASSLGTRMAQRLASDLGEAGFVVTSGLARGIDAVAHQSTLQTGTIAVQAGGVDVLYPAENAELARKIPANGLRLTEEPMGLQPQARHFPKRNRLIAALSEAVIVVEAAAKSGSLITARQALDMGTDVHAVPGHPMDGRASGCNMLIRDGALLVRSADDVIDALNVTAPAADPITPSHAPERPREKIVDLHREILARLGPSPIAEDQIIRDMAQPAAKISPVLVELELLGKVERQAGGLLARLN